MIGKLQNLQIKDRQLKHTFKMKKKLNLRKTEITKLQNSDMIFGGGSNYFTGNSCQCKTQLNCLPGQKPIALSYSCLTTATL